MRSFLVGNTVARPLLQSPAKESDSSSTMRLLWLACGDVRNFLTTLTKVPRRIRRVEALLNDASGLVGARNAAMLVMAMVPEDENHAIAMWCDALLTDEARDRLDAALEIVAEGKTPDWLVVASQARKVARLWRSLSISRQDALEKRRRRVGAGHVRCGSSLDWQKHGTVTTTNRAATNVNPTLFDVEAPDIPFVEDTGPSGAFRGLQGLAGDALAKALREAWQPLFDALRNRTVSIEISVEDCCSRRFRGSFDAVDSSNASDYVGLYNLVLSCPPTLFLRTEHVLTVASGIDAVLAEEFPFDLKGSKRALRAAGWTPAAVPEADESSSSSEDERVVRIDWRRCRKLAMKRDDARTLLSQLFERSVPLPMNADMLEEETRPVELSYAWPKVTCATIVEFALACRRRDVKGALDALLECPDLSEAPLVRNHVLCLEMEIAARKRRCKLLAPRAILKRRLPGTLKWIQVPIPGHLFQPRSGLFEPSLAVLLLRDENALASFTQNQGWVKEENDDGEENVFNAAFDWLQNADLYTAQLLDRVDLAPFANTLKIPVPAAATKDEMMTSVSSGGSKSSYFSERPITDYFKFLLLLDVQTYSILGTSLRLEDLL